MRWATFAESGMCGVEDWWSRKESSILTNFSSSSSNVIGFSRPSVASTIGLWSSPKPSRIFSMRSSWSMGLPRVTSSSAQLLMNCRYVVIVWEPLTAALICYLICLIWPREGRAYVCARVVQASREVGACWIIGTGGGGESQPKHQKLVYLGELNWTIWIRNTDIIFLNSRWWTWVRAITRFVEVIANEDGLKL